MSTAEQLPAMRSSEMFSHTARKNYRMEKPVNRNRYEVKKKPSYEEVQMNTFSGKGKTGILVAFAVLLMPLLGVGTASAYEVGEKVDLMVPDMAEFAVDPEVHQFTCRAITDHAVWFVQDTSAVNGKGGLGDSTFAPRIVWGSDPSVNLVDPAEFATLTQTFENSVWGTVTAICGIPDDINNDGKVVVVLASMPSEYSSSQGATSSRNNMYYVDPEFFEIEGTELEVCFININPYSTLAETMPSAVDMRLWNSANALAKLALISNDPDEEPWIMTGLGEYAQHSVFGLTSSGTAKHGIYEIMNEFRKAPYIELINVNAGNQKFAYASSRGQQFLWFMYLAQREGEDLISAIAQDYQHAGMQSIAYAIDPSYDPETAVNDLVVPIYFDWLICNLHNDFRSDYMGGIYMYDFLEGTDWEEWAHSNQGASAAFSKVFNSFPIEGYVSGLAGMSGPIWASQYIKFFNYDQSWQTYLNGQYTDGRGARGAINSRWQGLIIVCDDSLKQFESITPISFDDLYNTSFNLTGEFTYLILTNNNPGGATSMRYYISNDYTVPETATAIHQNSVVSQFITVYTALVNESDELEGYDWVGPIFEATLGDSTVNLKMTSFYSTLWTGIFSAWNSGTYSLSLSGYDSTGHYVESIRDVAVGYADTDISLELDYASLFVPRGGAPTGAMITLAETDALGLVMESSISLESARGCMTSVLAGPVAIPDVNGTLSFASSTNEASVYRYTDQGWIKLNSWMQNGDISASVDQGGIYALGEGLGVFSPEIPAQLILGANAPNPFTAQTAISFGLPVSGNVRVNVFDMTGRLVNTLANEEMAAANHTIVWDGTDINGNTVGAGVYFCRLEAAGQVLTQKMLKVQ
jgi:hypothetical protein